MPRGFYAERVPCLVSLVLNCRLDYELSYVAFAPSRRLVDAAFLISAIQLLVRCQSCSTALVTLSVVPTEARVCILLLGAVCATSANDGWLQDFCAYGTVPAFSIHHKSKTFLLHIASIRTKDCFWSFDRQLRLHLTLAPHLARLKDLCH